MRKSVVTVLLPAALFTAQVLSQDLPRWRQVPDLHARSGAGAAYDEVRGRIVMFGGTPNYSGSTVIGDTWEWDGTRWLARSPRHVPPPRFAPAMAFDPVRGHVVMYGGLTWPSARGLADFWEWDGEDWLPIVTQTSPSAVMGTATGTDSLRGRVVTFGGLRDLPGIGWVVLDETWEWDGVDWQQMTPAHHPGYRYHAQMALSTRRGVMVTYGGTTPLYGVSPGGGPVNDQTTWEWDGIDWQAVPGFPGSPARGAQSAEWQSAPLIVPDPATGEVLLHGKDGTVTVQATTFRWDGTNWVRLFISNPSTWVPNLGSGAAAAMDLSRQQFVAFSGNSYAMSRGTWVFDASNTWHKAHESFNLWTPYQAVAYDPARDEYLFLQEDANILQRPMRTYRMPGASMESAIEEVAGVRTPPNRASGALCYDPNSGGMLLFGGGIIRDPNDTWLWDGSDWTEQIYAVNPPPGLGAPVYDSSRGDIVMPMNAFDGSGFQTWRWTRVGGWRQVMHIAAVPYAYGFPKAAYDPTTQRVVALIWQTLPGQYPSIHTWTFDGAAWREEQVVNQPPFFTNQVLYVPELGGVVAMVSQDIYAPDSHQIWRWDGADWIRVPTANWPGDPRPHFVTGMPIVFGGYPVYDSSRGRVRLFMPRGPGWFCEDLYIDRLTVNSTGPRLGSVWTATVHDATQVNTLFFLALSATEAPAISLRWRPELGAYERFPLGNDWLFQASAAAGLGLGVLDATGTGSFSLSIPNLAGLYGFRFHAAAVTIDPIRAELGVVTNHVTSEIQR